LGHSISVGTSSIDNENDLVNEFALQQNYPNPFNPTTKIRYNIKQNGMVNLIVYDLAGRQIAVLENTFKTAGVHQVNFDAANLPSGVYLYRLTAGSFEETKKMALMK